MYCPKCAAEVHGGARFCPQCGAVLAEGAAVGVQRPSAIAFMSLFLAILALFPFWGILIGVAAIVLGIAALRGIARSQGRLTGQGLAIAGIVVASVLMVNNLLVITRSIHGLKDGGRYSNVSRVRVATRNIEEALEAYFTDNNCYPAWSVGEGGANSFAGPRTGVYYIPTFRIWKNEKEKGTFHTLTTPMAYLVSYLRDPFADTGGATYGYYCDSKGWILWSWGPDRDESEREQWDLAADVEKVYHSGIAQPTLTLLVGTSSALAQEAYSYDAINGTVSPGDVWRVKQWGSNSSFIIR